MAVKQLYLRAGGKVVGPFDVSQVRDAARKGKVLPSHEGSADGQNWFRMETIWTKLVGEPNQAPMQGRSAASPADSPSPPASKDAPHPSTPKVAPRAPAQPQSPVAADP